MMDALKAVNVCNPVNCSTEERNMLSLLYDLFTVCSYLAVSWSFIAAVMINITVISIVIIIIITTFVIIVFSVCA